MAVLALTVLAGCATVAPIGPASTGTLAEDKDFEAAGRLSARHGNEGAAVHFTWRHTAEGDRIDVATPTGQTLAQLAGDHAGVRLSRPGESVTSYSGWPALTQAVFGVAIPVAGLAFWIVGRPVAQTRFGIERDGDGRPRVIHQDGWEIVYAYADGAPASRPSRLFMRFPDAEIVEVRIAIDRFGPAAH